MKIKVRVYPQAAKGKVVETGSLLKVYVTAAPERSKANKELLEVLAEYLKINPVRGLRSNGVKKSSLKIVRGKTSRDKTIEIL